MTESTTATTAAAKTTVWEDFVDIFFAPSQVFARRENNGFFVPLLVLTIVMTVLFYATLPLLRPVYEAEFTRGAATSGQQMTADQLATARRMVPLFGGIGLLFAIPIGALLTGLVLWIAGKLFDSQQTLRSAFVVSTYSFFPRVVEQIVNAIQGLFLDPSALDSSHSIKLGVSRFMDHDNLLLMSLVGRLDVFTIWVTVLVAIGLKVTGKVPMARAAIAAAIVWLVGAVPQVLGALRAG